MCKYKTTNKEMKTRFDTILCISYCDLQTLLNYFQPFAYTCGVYGWNADFYNFNGVVISTGYRPIGKKVDFEIVRKYELLAREKRNYMYENYKDYPYEKQVEEMQELLDEFLNEVLSEQV